MTDESLSTPEKMMCSHVWKNVAGAKSESGGRVVLCEKCNVTRELDPPVHERNKDKRPLLME